MAVEAPLQAHVAAPDLSAAGYELVGGRLLPAVAGPAAQFMYETMAGERLTLYVRTSSGGRETAFRFVEDDGISAFYWLDGPLGYALIAANPRDALLPVARTVYEQLNP